MEPKTRQSRRTIALPAVVVDALQHHKAKKSQERLLAGTRWHETGLVFTSTIGTPIEVGNLRRHFWKLLEKAGLPRMRFHDLRHSCASLLLVQGAPARVVWRRLDTRTSASRWTPIRTSCLSSSVRLQMRWIGPWALGPWRGECRPWVRPYEFGVASHEPTDPNVDPKPGSCNWSAAKNRRPRTVK